LDHKIQRFFQLLIVPIIENIEQVRLFLVNLGQEILEKTKHPSHEEARPKNKSRDLSSLKISPNSFSP